jgi:hypothetical protein
VPASAMAPQDLVHDNSSPFNTSGPLSNWPPAGYGTPGRVYKVAWVSYRIDSTLFGKPSLLRYQVGKPLQMVAHDITSFRVWYRLADETSTRNPLNLAMLNEVVPVVHPNGPLGSTATADSAWAAIRPRTF